MVEPQIIPLNISPIPPPYQQTSTSIVPILNIFLERAKWAASLLSFSQTLFDSIESNIVESSVIKQAVDISLTFLRQQVVTLKKSIDASTSFISTLEEHEELQSNLKTALETAKRIPIHKSFVANYANNTKLYDWIDKEEVERVSVNFETNVSSLREYSQKLPGMLDSVQQKVRDLENGAKVWFSAPEAPINSDSLLIDATSAQHEEIYANSDSLYNVLESWKDYKAIADDLSTVVRKIQHDCNNITSLPDTPANVRNATRIAQNQERELLPKAFAFTQDLWQIHEIWAISKAYNSKKAISFLRTLSQIQSTFGPIRSQLTQLNQTIRTTEEEQAIIARVVDMPYLYGALLFELIRRQEWIKSMKSHVSKTAETMAQWREDEIKRRTKWIRQLGGSLGMLKRIGGGGTSCFGENSDVPKVDITIINSNETKVYNLSRKDMDDYMQLLLSLNIMEDHAELTKLISKSDKQNPFSEAVSIVQQQFVQQPQQPNPQQLLRRKSLFKEGNLSEYAQTQSTTLSKSISLKSIDNNSNSSNSQSSNTDATTALKIQAYETRIRKLEDLLQRNQLRSAWPNKFKLNNSPPAEANSNPESKADSFEADRKLLMEKIEKLQKDLTEKDSEIEKLQASNKEYISQLENKNHSLEEARMMKSDLMANLSTKESEFNAERRSLREELSQAKSRNDDLEIELEREMKACSDLEEKLRQISKQKQSIAANQHRSLINERKMRLSAERRLRKLQARYNSIRFTAQDLSQRLLTFTIRANDMLECLGLQVSKEYDDDKKALLTFKIQRVKGLGRRARSALSTVANTSADLEESANNNDTNQEVSTTKSTSLSKSNSLKFTASTLSNRDANAGKGLAVVSTKFTLSRQGLVKPVEIDPSVLYWIDSDNDSEDGSEENDSSYAEDSEEETNINSDNDEKSSNILSEEKNSETDSILSNAESTSSSLLVVQKNGPSSSVLTPSPLHNEGSNKNKQPASQVQNNKATSQFNHFGPSQAQKKKSKSNSTTKADSNTISAENHIEARYQKFLNTIYMDYDLLRDSVAQRFGDVENFARRLQKEVRLYRERSFTNEQLSRNKISFKSFKLGELALFLPTRNPARSPNPWAAFNVDAPHYFLNPKPEHHLESREWLVARITKIEERIVDRSSGKEEHNPFGLSDGVRWHLLEAVEER